MIDSISPEILSKVAEFGDSYILYLYVSQLMPIPIIIFLFGGLWVVYKIVRREMRLYEEEEESK